MSLFKMVFLFLILSVFSINSYGQLVCSLGGTTSQYNYQFDQSPAHRALNELTHIYRTLCQNGCGNVVLFKNPTAPNALAIATGPNQSKIVYNPNFMDHVALNYGGGATFGILAHEFGHHIDFHTTPNWMNNSWSRELKADAWAGCALAMTGLSTFQIENALRAIAAYPSPSHPNWPYRVNALRTGFTNCGGNWGSSYNLRN